MEHILPRSEHNHDNIVSDNIWQTWLNYFMIDVNSWSWAYSIDREHPQEVLKEPSQTCFELKTQAKNSILPREPLFWYNPL